MILFSYATPPAITITSEPFTLSCSPQILEGVEVCVICGPNPSLQEIEEKVYLRLEVILKRRHT